MDQTERQRVLPPRRGLKIILVTLLSLQAALLAYAATRHSPTYDEPGHLVAGISYWTLGCFEVYRVNPPLPRLVAALPVMAVGCHTDWRRFHDGPGARPEIPLSEDFLNANGPRSTWLVTLARLACIPFAVIGGMFCFLWGRDLYGGGAGVLALVLWSFDPTVLGHAGLITPDVAASAFGLVASYTFWRWLRSPTAMHAIVAGIGLGLAELSKASWLFLFGLWPLLWVIWEITDPSRDRTSRKLRGVGLAAILGIAIYLLNVGYAIDGTGTRLGKFTFVSETLAGPDRAGLGGNRFAQHWIGHLPVPLPAQYVLGLDRQKRDFEDFGQYSYLRGHWKDTGWWYYYLYGLAVKLPHGTQLLLLLATLTAVISRRPRQPVTELPSTPNAITWRDELVLVAPAAILFLLVSSQTEFSHHFRYVLPCFGAAFAFAGRVLQLLGTPGALGGFSSGAVLAISCAAASLASSVTHFPHGISYFNELAGGPTAGHRHMLGSSVDWGQDLILLQEWLEAHPGAVPVRCALETPTVQRAIGLGCEMPPPGPHRNPFVTHPAEDLGPQPGWFAVGVHYLCGRPSGGVYSPDYTYFRYFTPVARIAHSIYVYHISAPEANRERARLGLPQLEPLRTTESPRRE